MTPFARRLAGVAALAFAVRAIHVAAISKAPFAALLIGDAREYVRWAGEIAGGSWIGTKTFYQAPLYPYLLAVLDLAGARGAMAIRWAQAFAGTGACVLLAWAGRRFISERAGLVAGVVLAIYPPAIFFDGLVQKASLDNLLMCALLAAAGACFVSPRPRNLVGLGAILGLLALTRENALIFVPVLAGWLLLVPADTPWRDRGRAAGLFAAGVVVVLLPVGLRNQAVGGSFLITTSQAGSNFYIGNHQGANGRYLPLRPNHETPEFERTDATEVAEAAAGHALTPGEVSSYWWSQSFAWMRAHPGDAMMMFVHKIFLTWNRAEIADVESLEVYADASPILGLLSSICGFGVLLALAVPGMVVAWRLSPRPVVLYALLVVFSLAVAAFYVMARYRYPMVPILALFAGAALVAARDFLRPKAKRPDRALVAACVAGVVLAALPSANPSIGSRRLAYVNLGLGFSDAHEYVKAAEAFRRAIELAPHIAVPHYELGRALAAQGRDAEAATELNRAIELDPASADARDELGALLVRRGAFADAEARFREANTIDPSRPTTLANLGAVALRQGRADEAVSWFGKAIERSPGTATYHYDLALAEIERGRQDDAVKELQEAIRLDPKLAAAYDDLGVILAQRGDLAGAEARFQESVRLDPARASALANLGGIAASRGQNDAAVTWFQKALAAEPRSTPTRLRLALVLERMGRIDEARREAAEALRLDPQSRDAAQAVEHFGR